MMTVSGARAGLLRPPAWVFVTFDLGGRKGAGGKEREDIVAGRMGLSSGFSARSKYGRFVRAIPGGAVMSPTIMGVRAGARALGD
jgi:hypothetical protein